MPIVDKLQDKLQDYWWKYDEWGVGASLPRTGLLFYAKPTTTLVPNYLTDGEGNDLYDGDGNRLFSGYTTETGMVDTIGKSVTLYVPPAPVGNVFFVSLTGGSNTAPYDTPAKAANNPRTVVDYIQSANITGPKTLVIAAGLYTGTSYCYFDSPAQHNDTLIIGAGAGQTIIMPDAGHPIYGTGGTEGVRVHGVSLAPRATGVGAYVLSCNGWDFTDVLLQSGPGHTGHLAYTTSPATTFRRTKFLSKKSTDKNPLYYSDAASGSVDYCEILPYGNEKSCASVVLYQSGNVKVRNTIILGTASQAIVTNTGVSNVENCILFGGIENGSAKTVHKVGGALHLKNNIIIAGPWNGDSHWIEGTPDTDEGNILLNSDPKFASVRNGYVLPCVDDAGAFGYAEGLEPLLASKSMKGNFYLEHASWNPANTGDLIAMAGRETIEISSHSHSHSDLAYTGKIWDVTKGVETITISRSNNTITLSGGGVVNGFRQKSLATIKSELESLGATVTGAKYQAAGSTTGTYINGNAMGESFADGVAVSQVDILIDATAESGYFKSELVDSKSAIEALSGVVINSFGAPYNALSPDAITAIRNAGYTNGRGSVSGLGLADTSHLANLNMYSLLCLGASTTLSAAEEVNVRLNARAMGLAAVYAGLVLPVLAHSEVEMTLVNWSYCLDEWSRIDGLVVTNHSNLANAVRSSDDFVDNGVGVFTREFYEPVLTVGKTSPCIGAGTDPFANGDGDQYDAGGYKVWDDTYSIPDGHWIDGVDIGAYAYLPSDKVYPKLSNPSTGVYKWESAPDILDITGVDNAVYNADGTGKTFATQELAFAAFASLANDVQIFAGDTQIAIYSTDQSENADKINRVLGYDGPPRTNLLLSINEDGVDTIGLSISELYPQLDPLLQSIVSADGGVTRLSDAQIVANIEASQYLNAGISLTGDATKGYALYSKTTPESTLAKAYKYFGQTFNIALRFDVVLAAPGSYTVGLSVYAGETSTVLWGDGGSTNVTYSAGDYQDQVHAYASAGTYTILIKKSNKLKGFRHSTVTTVSIGFDIDRIPNVSYLAIFGANAVTGDLSNCRACTLIYLAGSNTVYGDVANCSMASYVNIRGFNKVSKYTGGASWTNTCRQVYLLPASESGLDSSEVDSLLIDLASGVTTWITEKLVYLAGNNAPRTSASDAAVATLISHGVTVTVNT